jgi:steroid 5-alpha reductase family enzyme
MLLIPYCIQRFEGFHLRVIGIQQRAIIFGICQAGFAMLDLLFLFQHPTTLTPTKRKKIKEIAKGRRYNKTIPLFVPFFNRFSEKWGFV